MGRNDLDTTAEAKMRKSAETDRLDSRSMHQQMNSMDISDFEKHKMVAVFKCKPEEVVEKIRKEFRAKQFPETVIEAVTTGIDGVSSYEKKDDIFDHASADSKKGKSDLYQYAVWCKKGSDQLMEVGVWGIASNFKKGSKGTTTKMELDMLKRFMEHETQADVLKITNVSIADGTTPEQSMVTYAKSTHAGRQQEGLESQQEELINRMEITGFTKFRTNVSFRCARDRVSLKLSTEMSGKNFPEHIIDAVVEGIGTIDFYKKSDEDFKVHANNGQSTYHKYALWCCAGDDDEVEVSFICIAASFKKKSEGTTSKTEIETLAQYLSQEACTDVLKVHAPDALHITN